MALITSFNSNMYYYRQFVTDLPNPKENKPYYVYPIEKGNVSLFQIGDDYIDNQGVVISTGRVLDDYTRSDQLNPEDIATSRWQNGQWIKDEAYRPMRLRASDILKNNLDWPGLFTNF